MLSFIKSIIYSNLLVSLCVAAYTHLTYITYNLPSNNQLIILVMVFCFTYLTYNGQRIFRLKKYKKIGERLQWVVNHQTALRITSITFGLIGFVCLFFIHPISWWLIIPMGFLSMFYVIPIPFIKKGLRNIHYLKVFIIALVWALIIIGLPFIDGMKTIVLDTTSALAFIQCFVFILAITLPFDVRDIDFDKADELKTIPQLIGIKGTILFAELLLISSTLIYYYNNVRAHYFLALLIGHIITMIIVALTNKNRMELFYAGWVESSVIILWLCVITADFLSSL